MATKSVQAFSGTRITFTSSFPFQSVVEKLDKQIQANQPADLQHIDSHLVHNKFSFVDYISNKIGSIGFTKFAEINHSSWIRLFGVGDGLQLRRVILGNPLIAITMLEHDLDAGLFVPVELLLKELPGGKGTQVIYNLPSSVIAGVNPDEKLKAAAQVLDNKLESLVLHITSEDGE
ncbi:hypothetical protein PT974_05226 [Cladobotryum mycophilum]|uniref:DUF302 domain-containing protein n=1 Tax=Cladobotryum mycophilum TaxID=491253 RepID=A0ABR0SI74_9HYPO